MKSICVFCGSGKGYKAVYGDTATLVGTMLGKKGIRIIFGGGQVGLMGTVADAAMASGGEVIGIIPDFLATKEVAHEGVTEMIVVQSMHQRKNLMGEMCDGYIVLPGGLGTLEELFEVFSWDYLRLHNKPIGLLNAGGFYDKLIEHLNYTVAEGFLRAEQMDRLIVADDPDILLLLMEAHVSKEREGLDKERT